MELGEESTENQMNWVGEQVLGYGKVIHPDRIKRDCAKSCQRRSEMPHATSSGRKG